MIKTIDNKSLITLTLVCVLFAFCIQKETQREFKAVPIENKTLSYNSEFYNISAEYPVEQWDYSGDLKDFVDETVAYYRRDWSAGGMHYEDEMLDRELNPKRDQSKFEMNIRFEKFTSYERKIHSYLFYTYVFTGGANGMSTVTSFNFDENGLITPDVFFRMNDRKEILLTRLLAEKALTMPDVFNKQSVRKGLGLIYLKPDGLTADSTRFNRRIFQFKSNYETFIISDDGVHFYYDKYRLTPGAAGNPSIFLNWQQLTPFVNKNFNATK